MKKIFIILILFFGLFCLPVDTLEVLSRSFFDEINYVDADYAFDINDKKSIVDNHDFVFIGMITEELFTMQYNGSGVEIPFTYYFVTNITKIKGEVPQKPIIKFYGGVDQNNELFLFDDKTIPKINSFYLFICNQVDANSSDERTVAESFIISAPYNITFLDGYKKDKSLNKQNGKVTKVLEEYLLPSATETYLDIKNFSLLYNDNPKLEPDPGGGGSGPSGTSFESAWTIQRNEYVSLYIAAGYSYYYKFTTSSQINYMSLYSIGNFNVKVSVYDSEYNLIGGNDDCGSTGRGIKYTNNPNFYYYFYTEKYSTYYIKVQASNSTHSGNSTIRYIIDNYYTLSYESLVLAYNSVDSKMKIDYKTTTQYNNELLSAIDEWNKLDVIRIQPDTWLTDNDVTVSDYYGFEDGILGYYSKSNKVIKLNNFYFQSMNFNERKKTITHEFGHALGLQHYSHTENTVNVMYSGQRSFVNLGPADIAVYRKKWTGN